MKAKKSRAIRVWSLLNVQAAECAERFQVLASCVRLVHRENIPVLHASDWYIVRIYPCFMRLIGPL
eukprot:803982-Prorocentrum_minimum.AAC.1